MLYTPYALFIIRLFHIRIYPLIDIIADTSALVLIIDKCADERHTDAQYDMAVSKQIDRQQYKDCKHTVIEIIFHSRLLIGL